MNCKNCQKPLETSDKFCRECGAKVIDHRLTMKYLATETSNAFFNIDSSRPIRTFINMFNKPEEVISGYVDGTRKRFIHAFGYFTIALTFSGFFYFIILKFFPEAMDFGVNLTGQEYTPEQVEMNREIQKTVFDYQAAMTFISIPILALISYIVFYNKKKFNYAEHLVLNLYTFSHVSIVTILLYFLTIWNPKIFGVVAMLVFFIQIGFYAYVLKRVFKLSIKQLILKTLYFFILFIPLLLVIIIVVSVIMFLSGGMDEIIDAEKAKRGISYIASSVINWTS